MKTRRECDYTRELDLEALVWTRGPKCPLSSSVLPLAACGGDVLNRLPFPNRQRDEKRRMMSRPPPPKVKVFNYGIYTARDYWKQITKPHIDEYKSQRSPKNAVQVVQSLWGLVLWCADEQGKGWPIFVADLMVHHPEIFEWNWIRDIANSATHHGPADQTRTVKHIEIKGPSHLAYGYGEASGGYVPSEPVITLDNGSERKLLHVVLKFEKFWQTWFQEPPAAPPSPY